MAPEISVIIPVYNVGKYLRNCLNSVVKQSFDSYEVIIVDDGSTDECRTIEEEFKNQYSNIHLIQQENKGIGNARNTGFDAAQGKYILFVDSDDSIDLDTLRLLYNKAVEEDADLVFYGFHIVTKDSMIIKTENDFHNKMPTLKQNPQLLMDWPVPWNKLISSKLLRETNLRFPEKVWYEDLRMIPKLYLHANVISYVEQPLYMYLKRKGSASNVHHVKYVAQIMDAVDDLFDYFKEQGAFEQYKDELEFIATYHAFYLGSIRVAKAVRKHQLLLDLKKYIENKVPNYMNNKFLYRLGSKRLVVLKLLNKQHYLAISMLLKLKDM